MSGSGLHTRKAWSAISTITQPDPPASPSGWSGAISTCTWSSDYRVRGSRWRTRHRSCRSSTGSSSLVGGQSGLKAHVLQSKTPADARRIVEEHLKARLLGAIEAAQTAKEGVQKKVRLVRSVSGRLESQLDHAKSTAERLLGRPLLIAQNGAAHAEPAASTTPSHRRPTRLRCSGGHRRALGRTRGASLPSRATLSTAATTLSQLRRAVDAEAIRQGVPSTRLAQSQRELAELQETLDAGLDVQQNTDRYRSHMARDPASCAANVLSEK